ncbi:MAG TPA: ArsR family transcriptional regulator [Chloroflexi bacterium]|nr:ArsR family transcriptional regulator [Chloroflexota bacterium]
MSRDAQEINLLTDEFFLLQYVYNCSYIQEFTVNEAQPPLDEQTARQLAELFRALSDPSRVRIIAALLEGETNVRSLANLVGISESAVSHQLRTLRQMRLVRARRQGREVFYALDDEHVADLFRRGLDHVLHG